MGRRKNTKLGVDAMRSAPTEGGPYDQRLNAPPRPKRTITERQREARMENLRRANKKLMQLKTKGLLPPRRNAAMIAAEKRQAHQAQIRKAEREARDAHKALSAPPPPSPPSGPITLTIEADTAHFGPAMLALPNDRWRAFVIAFIHHGTRDLAKAYKAAGFETDKSSGPGRLTRDPRFQAALREETENHLKTGMLAAATKRLGDIIEDPKAKHADALKAALAIWDRAGFHEVSEQKVTVERLGADPQQLERIRLKFEQLGLGMDAFNRAVGARLAALAPPPTTAAGFSSSDAEYTEEGREDAD